MPAAAVIPAPIAYIKVVAVKKLVVGFVVAPVVHFWYCWVPPSLGGTSVALGCLLGMPIVYCEKISAFKAGLCR